MDVDAEVEVPAAPKRISNPPDRTWKELMIYVACHARQPVGLKRPAVMCNMTIAWQSSSAHIAAINFPFKVRTSGGHNLCATDGPTNNGLAARGRGAIVCVCARRGMQISPPRSSPKRMLNWGPFPRKGPV